MQVIMKICPTGQTREYDRRYNAIQVAKDAFEQFCSAFDDTANDPEVYLRRPDEGEAMLEDISFRDGLMEPDFIRDRASGWNAQIQQDFNTALNDLVADVKTDENGVKNWLGCESYKIYNLKCAAMALDGSRYDFGEYALLIKSYITVILEDVELREIMEHPEKFVYMDVTPK